MSKLDDSLLSGSRGRTGRLVVANVNGVEILKIRPKKSSKSASPKQELIRSRMSMCYDFITSYKSYVSLYFGNKIGLKTSYNQAMSNLLNAFKLNFQQQEINIAYAEILFSKGPLPAPQPVAVTSSAAQQIEIQWYDNAAGNPDRENDQLQVLCAVEGEPYTVFFQDAAVRTDAEVTITVPPTYSGKTLHVYMAFNALASLQSSLSAYVGTVVVQ